ncbi:hypothetical protein [Clostridium oryzae]|uniref:Endonuclease MutS2 n=1 Tax=Clostridium oryzae TaxID=1450648 RepID=A0A1V4IEZ1_9CLOT|nr:hypothetical protein [Clostridium oryzae]OPJ58572.1 endonuclease MutS2 [Clostridium oryzae]
MNIKTIELLEYDRIKENLKSYAISDLAKEMIDKLEPYVDMKFIGKCMNETTEARTIANISSSIPIHGLNGIKNVKEKLQKCMVLSPEDLDVIAGLLGDTERLKRFMESKESAAPVISQYARSFYVLDDLREEIIRCIAYGRVDDKASSKLSKIRKK